MPHLQDRLCLIPFCDLADCPEKGHHAIGSPYFDASGKPLFADPVVVVVRADITEPSLPKCSSLAVSCNTRPYHSYGPVIRKVFEKSQPHVYPEVRLGMEGVMEIGEVRQIPPGGLFDQTERIFLTCVATMTAGTNQKILQDVLQNLAREFGSLAHGSTLRMPIMGTGKARSEEDTEKMFRTVVSLTLDCFLPEILPDDMQLSPRRLLLVHPMEYESSLIASSLAQKAVFLTLLDKLNLSKTDKRIVYGLAHGNDRSNQFINKENFSSAMQCFDKALDFLLEGKRKEAIKASAEGCQIEPDLCFLQGYITSLANQKEGVLDVLTEEILSLARKGNIREALCAGYSLKQMGQKKQTDSFFEAIQNCYKNYCSSALESRLLYENYQKTQDALAAIQQGLPFETSSKNNAEKALPPIENFDALAQISQKIPSRFIENTFHIVIRKFMASPVETSGAKRALDNLLELHKLQKIELSEEIEKQCKELHDIADSIEQKKQTLSEKQLHKEILEKLLVLLPNHGTLRLEAARFYLKGENQESNSRLKTLTRADIVKAWKHLEIGHEQNPRDYGILCYLGFIIFMQGPKHFSVAEDFFKLFSHWIEYEIGEGKYGIRPLKSPKGEWISIPIHDSYTKLAYSYYQKYAENARDFALFAKILSQGEGMGALNLYKRGVQRLGEIGRYDLMELYENLLGETWVALLSRNQQTMGSISLFFGEISLDLLFKVYKKVRSWWKYSHLQSSEIKEAIGGILKKMTRQMETEKTL
ncbi:MAG: hypothetical protein HUU50_13680 [Candidatus Brocadiae bacterium]|nr:hypothetical protein [Candidatus Brocadiia bacterium]